jgi:hypothetical protein
MTALEAARDTTFDATQQGWAAHQGHADLAASLGSSGLSGGG